MEVSVRYSRLVAIVFAAAMMTGCTQVVSSGPDEIQVDTGQFGSLVPGTRQWISWFEANEHCAEFGKKPKLVDLKDTVAVYRCVTEE